MNVNYLLNTGHNIPLIGFGTYKIQGQELIHKVLDTAIECGYRHIDTAVVYRNEHHIGEALTTLLPKHKLKREDIFITSKLIPTANVTGEKLENLVKTSLSNLKTKYIDLYLIHWPGVSGLDIKNKENQNYRYNTWKTLVKLQKEGLIRSVGVSNYTVRHLEELLENCEGVPPSVNQVEWHPRFHQPELLKYCRENGIFLQAYSSLGTSSETSLREDPEILKIAKKLGKTSSQILLRWSYQQNIGILPKASSKGHIDENFDLDFEIPEELLDKLNHLDQHKKFAWDPTVIS